MSRAQALINKEDRGRVYTKLRSFFVYETRRHSTNAASLLISSQSIRWAWAELWAFPKISGMPFCMQKNEKRMKMVPKWCQDTPIIIFFVDVKDSMTGKNNIVLRIRI